MGQARNLLIQRVAPASYGTFYEFIKIGGGENQIGFG